MDQSTLVDDQIYDGRRFIQRFAADGNPIQAAFWAKAEESDWYLCVVTELTDRSGPAAAYRVVNASLKKLDDVCIAGSEIKVISPNTPIAKDVLAAMAQHTGRSAIHRVSSARLEQVYVYPRHLFTFDQVRPMTTDDIEREILGLMHRAGAKGHDWARIALKDGTGFDGIPLALQVHDEDGIEARFLVNETGRVPRIRPVKLDQIASIS